VSCEAPACPKACETSCNDCCEKKCFLSRLHQRSCDCQDSCREGLLQRLCRNRFACESSCGGCDGGACSSSTTTAPMPPPEQIKLPKALPRN
jgi:hypothetical protein